MCQYLALPSGQLVLEAGSLSVLSYGADSTGAADSGSAFDQAVAAASSQGKVLYVPPGTYTVNRHIIVNNVTIRGAGPWYTVLRGDGIGVYGNYAPNPSTNVKLYDFAIFGEVTDRNDGAQVNGIGGALNNSTVDRVWVEHMKVGAWMDGPFTNLVFNGMRIRDTTADGVNFHGGVTNSTVTNSELRNTGDDGLATWAVMRRGLALGHGTRAGLEDATVLPDGSQPAGNAELVRTAAELIAQFAQDSP